MTDLATSPQRKPSAMPVIIGFAIVEILVIAIGIGPWMVDRHHALGRRYAKQGQFEQAIDHYQKLHAKFPESTTINFELGQVYLNAGKFEEAIPHLKLVAESADPPPQVFARLGLAYLRARQNTKALFWFHQALKQNDRDPVAAFFVGEEFYRQKEYTVAASYYERASADPSYRDRAQSRLKEIEKEVLGQ